MGILTAFSNGLSRAHIPKYKNPQIEISCDVFMHIVRFINRGVARIFEGSFQ